MVVVVVVCEFNEAEIFQSKTWHETAGYSVGVGFVQGSKGGGRTPWGEGGPDHPPSPPLQVERESGTPQEPRIYFLWDEAMRRNLCCMVGQTFERRVCENAMFTLFFQVPKKSAQKDSCRSFFFAKGGGSPPSGGCWRGGVGGGCPPSFPPGRRYWCRSGNAGVRELERQKCSFFFFFTKAHNSVWPSRTLCQCGWGWLGPAPLTTPPNPKAPSNS